MLNKNTRSVLKALTAINTEAIITYPVTGIKMGGNIQAFFNLEKLGEAAFENFGVYSLPEFLEICNALGEDSEIDLDDDGIMHISNDNAKIRYGTTPVSILEETASVKLDMVDRIKNNTKVTSFEMSNIDLDKIKKISSTLKELSELHLETNELGVELTVQGKEKSSNSIALQMSASNELQTKIKLVMGNISKLPNSSYTVTVYQSSKGTPVCLFESQNVEDMFVVIAATNI